MTEEKGTVVTAKIVPNSKEFKIVGFDEWSNALKIKVKGAPEKGKANRELAKKLEEMLKTKVKILKGEKSGSKKILMENYSKQKLLDAIKKPLKRKKKRPISLKAKKSSTILVQIGTEVKKWRKHTLTR